MITRRKMKTQQGKHSNGRLTELVSGKTQQGKTNQTGSWKYSMRKCASVCIGKSANPQNVKRC